MAERRMFAKTIIDSDAFLDMPLSAQCLYFHLNMRADDDGFLNNPKKIQRMIGATEDDLKLLIVKRFLIPFDTGVVVIKHWKIHNYIQKDRYKETLYLEEKAQLSLKSNNSYTEKALDTECIQDVSKPDTQVRLGKVRLGEDSIDGEKSTRFVPPTLEEVTAYCNERRNTVNPEMFIAFYESKGWMVGKNKMKDWKRAIITWEQRDKRDKAEGKGKASYNLSELDRLGLEIPEI